jgi:tetratricopeptide (TPR) repeat protein
MRFEDREVHSLVQSYERAIENDRQPYYDVEDLETIVNYYYDTGSFEQMAQAIKFSILLHPHSLVFKIKEIQLDLATRDFTKAQAKLQQMEGLSDHHVELLIARATLFMHQGKTERALELLDSALKRAEDQEEILQQIIDAHLAQGAYAHAAEAILKLCELDEELDDGTIYQLALCFDFMHQYDRAIEVFEKFIEREPYNALLWYQKAAFSLRLNKENEALEYFDWAITADDSFHAAHFEIGRIHERNDRLIEAMNAYRQSISTEVPSGYIYFRIGMIEQELGSLNAALRAFNSAIEQEPDLEDVYLERANVLCELDRHKEAVSDYKKVWITGNYGAEDVIDYVEALVELDVLDEAIQILYQAVGQFDDNPQLRLILAGYLFATASYEEARVIMNECLDLEPTSIELFHQYFPAFGKIPEITGILAEIQSAHDA